MSTPPGQPYLSHHTSTPLYRQETFIQVHWSGSTTYSMLDVYVNLPTHFEHLACTGHGEAYASGLKKLVTSLYTVLVSPYIYTPMYWYYIGVHIQHTL